GATAGGVGSGCATGCGSPDSAHTSPAVAATATAAAMPAFAGAPSPSAAAAEVPAAVDEPAPAAAAAAPAPAAPAPPPPAPPTVYRISRLDYGVFGDGTKPEVRLGDSSWMWQRDGLSMGGTRYAHGVSVHAPSSLTIDLNRRCVGYEALVGVDDLSAPLGVGGVRFSVYGDGERLWRSEVVEAGDPPVPVQVNLAGRGTIRLVVEPHTPFGRVAIADWARSQITCA
ncbi:RNA polymerase subunit sigma-24, partial [Streptomyces sp. ms191]|uniref:NPCBM/NEW2 domain-containing protein n=1 Tax=Streptomyces sp. ms191 TaxID=1827978 RepID=UPI0013125208